MLRSTTTWALALAWASLAALAPAADAVILDGQNECTVKLKDGTEVRLIGEFQSRIGTRGFDEGVATVFPLEDFRGPLAPVVTEAAAP